MKKAKLTIIYKQFVNTEILKNRLNCKLFFEDFKKVIITLPIKKKKLSWSRFWSRVVIKHTYGIIKTYVTNKKQTNE